MLAPREAITRVRPEPDNPALEEIKFLLTLLRAHECEFVSGMACTAYPFQSIVSMRLRSMRFAPTWGQLHLAERRPGRTAFMKAEIQFR
jgi:hypothetical protein